MKFGSHSLPNFNHTRSGYSVWFQNTRADGALSLADGGPRIRVCDCGQHAVVAGTFFEGHAIAVPCFRVAFGAVGNQNWRGRVLSKRNRLLFQRHALVRAADLRTDLADPAAIHG